MLMIFGCIVYPTTWDQPKIVEVCETSTSYYSGKCAIKWPYILAIVGIFDVLLLSALAFVLSRSQPAHYRQHLSNGYNDNICYQGNTHAMNPDAVDYCVNPKYQMR